MQLTKKISQNRIDEKTYRKLVERASYSDLKLLENNREKFFREKILGEKRIEKKTDSTLIGDIVHTLLANVEGEFDKKFFMSQTIKPTGQVLLLCDELYTRTLQSTMINEEGERVQQDTFETIFQDAVNKVAYNYKGEVVAFKEKGGVKSIEKIMEMFQESGLLYYNECIENVDRTVVTVADIEKAEKIANKVKQHPSTREYANDIEEDDNIDIFNELPILFEIAGVPYRAMPDKIRVLHDKKQVQVVDWKTSWSSEDGIIDTYLKLGYYLQAAMYQDAVREWCKEHDMADYTVLPMLYVFCDSVGWNDPIKFQLTQDDVDRGHRGFSYRGRRYRGLTSLKEDLQYYLENGVWTQSREIAQNNGYLNTRIMYGSK